MSYTQTSAWWRRQCVLWRSAPCWGHPWLTSTPAWVTRVHLTAPTPFITLISHCQHSPHSTTLVSLTQASLAWWSINYFLITSLFQCSIDIIPRIWWLCFNILQQLQSRLSTQVQVWWRHVLQSTILFVREASKINNIFQGQKCSFSRTKFHEKAFDILMASIRSPGWHVHWHVWKCCGSLWSGGSSSLTAELGGHCQGGSRPQLLEDFRHQTKQVSNWGVRVVAGQLWWVWDSWQRRYHWASPW